MRPSFQVFKETRDKAICVEVGVAHGDNAVDMLDNSRYNFVLVDSCDVNNTTFQWADPKENLPHVFTQEERDAFIVKLMERLAKYGDRARLLIKDSVRASNDFDDESIDYVYIDAQHEGKNVIKDLHAWWPKVKKGGYIAGHDYGDGVEDAVKEMFGTDYKVDREDWYKEKK